MSTHPTLFDSQDSAAGKDAPSADDKRKLETSIATDHENTNYLCWRKGISRLLRDDEDTRAPYEYADISFRYTIKYLYKVVTEKKGKESKVISTTGYTQLSCEPIGFFEEGEFAAIFPKFIMVANAVAVFLTGKAYGNDDSVVTPSICDETRALIKNTPDAS